MTRVGPRHGIASETLEPARPRADDGVVVPEAFAATEPVLELLYHPSLARIGAATRGWPGDGVVRFGRRSPEFVARDGAASPLDDPFVSREQARIRWLPHALAFEVTPATDARQPLASLSLETGARTPITAPTRLPAGAALAVGARALVRLGCRAPRDAEADDLGLAGESAAARALRAHVQTVARFREGVLLLGETGVGKELVARALHRASGAAGAFVAVNTGGLDAGTASSELFGHVRGAFTGAHQARRGALDVARHGTLFLDEIGDMPGELQTKLLRVLEDRRYTPVGGTAPTPLECRVVAATHHPLRDEVDAGRFRRDLYERLRALTIPVPPLRERRDDVPMLFVRFLSELAAQHGELAGLWRPPTDVDAPVPLSFFEALMRRPWPGNVRELRNAATGAAAATLLAGRFDPGDATSSPAATSSAGGDPGADRVREALVACRGNVRAAAERLGFSRAHMYRWLAAHGVDPSGFRRGMR